MTDILITSSVLILALLVIRQVFKKVLSRRLQYALWGLVLVRLLVPVSLPAADFSVLTAAEPIQVTVDQRLEQVVRPSRPETGVPAIPPAQWPLDHVEQEVPPLQWDQTIYPGTYYPSPADHPKSGITAGEALALAWKVGMAVMGAFFLLSNLWFWLRLRHWRQIWDAAPYGMTRKVYLVDEGVIPSPCLFGSAIYLTPAALRSEESLRHVLTHEETHVKHLDPLWSLLRCVCLAVYWFDPLVWVAAICSKTDCELACDEAVLKKLGEAQRIPYGQTLLSLIPVKRVANPLLTATTMTAGKRQLKDRITRIAQKPRQLAIAVVAVAVLALAISACTFTGGEPVPDPSPTPTESLEPNALRSLTGEELQWFNEEFFNGKDENGYYLNQFVNFLNLYDRPEDIDLLELFYCDGEELIGEEYSACGIDHADYPYYKLTAEYIDDVLTRYTGLTLEQTNKVNFSFSYQEAIDAYIWGHGDTNYPGNIEFLYGTREGSTVKLYHHGWGGGSNWFCTTLAQQPGGNYWFISNQKSEKPAIPTPLPAWEPEAIISLSGLTPYVAPTVEVTAYPNHYSFNWETCYANWNFDGLHVMVYRADDGVVYAAYEENDVYYVFQSGLSEKRDCVSYYENLLGHRGFYLDYDGQYSEHSYGPIRDYYYFTGDNVLTLLARCRAYGGTEVHQIDWDGDGTDELVSPWQLFFMRDGVVYEAQMDELLLSACPELSCWDYGRWDTYGKYLYAQGESEPRNELNGRHWGRYLYFDGENLLSYKDQRSTIDHILEGADVGVPTEVVAAVKECTEKIYQASKTPTVPEPEGEAYALGYPAVWDDWRVQSLYGPYNYTFGDVTVEAWGFIPQLHTTTPDEVIAEWTYLDEDNWVSAAASRNKVFFRKEYDGTLTFLWDDYMSEPLNSEGARDLVLQRLMELRPDIVSANSSILEYGFELVGVPGDNAYHVLADSSGNTSFELTAETFVILRGTWTPSFASIQVRLELEDGSPVTEAALAVSDVLTASIPTTGRYQIKVATGPDDIGSGTLTLLGTSGATIAIRVDGTIRTWGLGDPNHSGAAYWTDSQRVIAFSIPDLDFELPEMESSFTLSGLSSEQTYQVLTGYSGETTFEWTAGTAVTFLGSWFPPSDGLQLRLELEGGSTAVEETLTPDDFLAMTVPVTGRYQVKVAPGPDEITGGALLLFPGDWHDWPKKD